jgi:hypothetical protein
MTGRTPLIACILALAALALPAHVAAQDAAPAPAANEAAQIQARLQQIQARAVQDPELQAAQAALGEEVVATMARLDPAFTARSERARAMQADIAAAQEAQDNERLHALAAEAEEIQAAFNAARARAMEDEQLQASIKAYQDRVVAKMIELDAETEALLARLNELQ